MTPQTSSIEIVRLIAFRHCISVADLTGKGRSKKLWAARREAVVALRKENLSFGRIAHLLKRGKSTVENYLNPKPDRHRSKEQYIKKNGKKVRLCPEIMQQVTEYAGAEGVGIDVAANALIRNALRAQT